MDSERLLYDINELNHLFRNSVSVETLLGKAVEMVAERTQSAVCSIYLYNPEAKELTLRATRGLNPESVGQVRLKLGQGLTGLALQEMRAVCEADASRSPNYKFFPGIFEERYNAFLAVPIARGISKMGVLVVQRDTSQCFIASDVTALETVASQLANIIENAQFILGIHEPAAETPKGPPTELRFVKGKMAAEGFAYAPAVVLDKQRGLATLSGRDDARTYTLDDFRTAVVRTESQLEQLQEQVENKLSDAASLIFAAHLMILKDRDFVGRITAKIESGVNAPAAVSEVATGYMRTFLASDSAYMQEKANDIEDLAVRLVNNLVSTTAQGDAYRDHVVVTRALFPSDLLKLSTEGASAVILVGGGVTSHISILARSLAMPMVITDTFDLLNVRDGTPLLVDAEVGNVFVDPDDSVLNKFWTRQRARLTLDDQKKLMKPVTTTADGTRVRLTANINLLTDLKVAVELHCDGIGLYRTEFPFIIRSTFPSEAEQYVIYRKLVESMPDKPVTFRTLDAGGDKILSYYHDVKEQNPAMGMRSIRFSLQNKAIFAEQVRAILRAGVGANLRIMFPMISSLEEFQEARQVVHDSIASLARQGLEHNDKPSLGMMVELPAVVDLAEEFAREADFFSIGTNDLIQFMLAADRTNENVASFYLPHHPAVLRTLARVARAALSHDCDVSICGDMAHDTRYTPFLLGIGVKAFSVDPIFLLRTQQAITATSLPEAQALAKEMLDKSRISDIAALLPAQAAFAEQ
ncbi:MAG TPA: phosphoenolpyruvate--protein phosphotransferase [Sedimentisphaerales bacterium]|jgi:phosphotransferase system enzyme I (PtsP)|nr:phosphoenolpyruvate--protein phosphotransferase [Sedimentisphaerales bacterium]HNU29959.1 phosphoenolpyruvate--protein phosphotransferase [Sedimentisphaerales bacterium]